MMEFHLQKRDPVPVPLFLFTKKLETKPHQFSWFSGTLHVMFCDLQLSGGNALKLIYLTPRLRSAHIRSLASSDCSQLRSLFFHVGHAANHVEGCLRRTNLAYLGIVLGHKKRNWGHRQQIVYLLQWSKRVYNQCRVYMKQSSYSYDAWGTPVETGSVSQTPKILLKKSRVSGKKTYYKRIQLYLSFILYNIYLVV